MGKTNAGLIAVLLDAESILESEYDGQEEG